MADSAPSKPKRNGMQDALDPQSPASLSRPLRADFSFPSRSVIRSGFQLAMSALNHLRRSRWDQPATTEPSEPHADRMTWVQKMNRLNFENGNNAHRLAKKIGSAPSTLASQINSGTPPKADIAIKLANELGVTVTWLFDDEKPWPPESPHILNTPGDLSEPTDLDQISDSLQLLKISFEQAAESLPAETLVQIRTYLIREVQSIEIPARSLENLPLVDPDKAWRD